MRSKHTTEIWMPVVGFEGSYEISNMGRVRSVDRVITRSDGTKAHLQSIMRKQNPGTDGYLQVNLRLNGKGYTRRTHRMVLDAFVGTRPNGMESRHLNGDKLDNRLSNLCWGSPWENLKDKWAHGTALGVVGEENHKAKLVERDVRNIRWLYENTPLTQIDLGEIFGVSNQAISYITRRVTWKHVL